MNYLTGFVVEKTLALDNVFVIAMLFSFFHIPAKWKVFPRHVQNRPDFRVLSLFYWVSHAVSNVL